jgi:hypothetical protein
MNAVNQASANSGLPFEDIDCMKSSKSRAEVPSSGAAQPPGEKGIASNGVTLSSLLNVLDGF